MKHLSMAAAALLPVILAAAAPPQDPASAISGSMAISGIIADLRNAVADTIANADDAVSANTFRTRQHLQTLLSQIDALAQGTIDKTFGELTAVEQQAFKDISNQVYRLESLQKATATDVKRVTYSVATAMDKLPFVRGTPLVMEYAPLYLVSRQKTDGPVTLRIEGSSLGNGVPTFTIGGKPCAKGTQTAIALSFTCPASLFLATSAITPVSGELVVTRTLTWWERVKSWFGNVPPPQRYTLVVQTIPDVLGAYTIKAVVTNERVRTQPRSQEFRDGNGHCSGRRQKLFEFSATPEWAIYSNSISVQCSGSRSSRCLGTSDVSAHGFGYRAVIENHGNCGPFWKDARGTVWGSASWTEFATDTETSQRDINAGNLYWNKGVSIKLPDNTKSVSVAVRQIDGHEPIVMDGDARSPWFETEYNKGAQMLIIRAKPLDEALKSS